MSIAINKAKCVGCGSCLTVCPGSLLARDEAGKAYIKYPRDCWGCASCLKECHQNAIDFYLGEDIGGKGSLMHTEEKGDVLLWKLTRKDKSECTIEINRKEANKY
ncbi:MAG: ferredoxin family protein [Lachnospiraceae bacterium]